MNGAATIGAFGDVAFVSDHSKDAGQTVSMHTSCDGLSNGSSGRGREGGMIKGMGKGKSIFETREYDERM